MRNADPRWLQIAFLATVLWLGVFVRDFDVSGLTLITVLIMAWVTQAFWILLSQAGWDSFLSSTISGLSILLFCRANSIEILLMVTFLTISSKYLFRFRGKHFFNPTNFGILVVLFLTERVWVSPAQWGSHTLLTAWIGVVGLLTVIRSSRFDSALVFLASYALLLGGRVWYLGQSPATWTHQLSNGTLLLFAFCMITDPRSTPDDQKGRVVFAICVAMLAFYLRFWHHVPAAQLWALLLVSPFTILLDQLWHHSRFSWKVGNVRLHHHRISTV